jgi:uroporphyrinogen decarboxylase
MTSEERVMAALNHKEADKVPLDFAGHLISGIHTNAYRRFLDYLGKNNIPAEVLHQRQQAALVHEDVLRLFGVDTRSLVSTAHRYHYSADAEFDYYTDEWGITWRKEKANGLYFDLKTSPFRGDAGMKAAENALWPDWSTFDRLTGLKERSEEIKKTGYAQVLDLPVGLEVFDGCFNLRGFEDFYCDLASDEKIAEYFMDKQLDLQIRWWQSALSNLPNVRIVRTGDDLGDQRTTRISPEMYRRLIKPRHKKLFDSIKKAGKGNIAICLHSDGAIRDLIPDLIEAGVDCLNPIQYTLPGMGAADLKREFGRDLVFWGGGIDIQEDLVKSTPAQIKDKVTEMIEILAPGGGFICCQTHIIQSDAPPENIQAYLETVRDYTN